MSVCCSKIKINPLFDGIKEGAIGTPIEKLVKHYKNVDMYTRLLADKKDNVGLRMLYYVMCRPKMTCVIIRKQHTRLSESSIHNHTIEMEPNGIMYLMFQLLTVRHFFKEATERVNALFKTTKKLYVYFIEYPSFKDLEIDNKEVCYRSWNFLETITAAKLILPENNKWYLENSRFDRLSEKHFYRGFKTFNTVTVWLYKTFSLLELERFYFFSGIFWQYLGVRPIGDLDIIISKEGGGTVGDAKIIDKLYVKDPKTGKYSQPHDSDEIRSKTDVFLENVFWHPFWDHLYVKGSKALYPEITKPEQFMFEPKCFIYFYGFKCSNPELSIMNRYIRNRPRGTAELIMANEILNFPVQVPPLPTFYLSIPSFAKAGDEETKYTKYTDFEATFVKANKTYTAKELKKHTVPVDEKKWLGTIQWYLKRDYRTIMSPAKIKEKIEKAPKFNLKKLGIISK